MLSIGCTARSTIGLCQRNFRCQRSRNLNTTPNDINPLPVATRKARWHRTRKESNFVDNVSINVEGGQGGDGCVAFAREKFNPFGPPSGAAGGEGGSIFVRATLSTNTLARIPHQLVAGRGEHGSGDWQAGKKGVDRIIDVPVGTVVHVRYASSPDETKRLMKDYEDLIRSRYRSRHARSRRERPDRRPIDSKEQHTPIELRAQRDAVWRYYSGAIGHSFQDDYENKTNSSDASEDEESWAASAEVNDAESDIRGLGRSFSSAERRLGFALLDAEGIGESSAEDKVFDLDNPTEDLICIARGGRGGYGNAFFASANNRSPTVATRGRAGETVVVTFDLRFKGDVGLVGMPNAGKSTFLKAVCATGDQVRVAEYAFTTLTPNVGTVRLGEEGLLGLRNSEDNADSVQLAAKEGQASSRLLNSNSKDEIVRFTLHDLPGLIEGASDNRGLGHEFLKHVERCSALYYMVDVSDSAPTPWEDVRMVFNELEYYKAGLTAKIRGIIANKCDAIATNGSEADRDSDMQALQKLKRLREDAASLHNRAIPVWNVSAKFRSGVAQAAQAMSLEVEKARSQSRC